MRSASTSSRKFTSNRPSEAGLATTINMENFEVILDRVVMAFAGCIILASLALGHYVSPWWYLLTAFAGVNLIQSSYTGVCLASLAFKGLGVKPGPALR